MIVTPFASKILKLLRPLHKCRPYLLKFSIKYFQPIPFPYVIRYSYPILTPLIKAEKDCYID